MRNCPSCNSENSPDAAFCRSCGNAIPDVAATSVELEQEVLSLLNQGNKIEAIKVYRNQTGSSLKAAKDAVEALQSGGDLPLPPARGKDIEADVLRLLGEGEKVKAVKLYRDHSGATLFDSKQAVEAVAERNGIMVEKSGCGCVPIILFAALCAIAAAGVLLIVKS